MPKLSAKVAVAPSERPRPFARLGRTAPAKPSVLEAMATLGGDIALLKKEYEHLLQSQNRHGTLQVMRAATGRCQDALKALIESEEI